MPRPREYDSLHARQAAYHQTEKGKAAVEKYEESESAKARKRRWWREHKGSEPVNMRQQFIDTYGQPSEALQRLTEREQQVISLYFGLALEAPQSLEDIGKTLGVSKQRIGQIKSAALKKIPPKSSDS